MTLLALLKIIHVLAAIVAVGSNLTFAFWINRAGRDRGQLVFAIQGIRRLDRILANPGYVVLLLTGIGMVLTGSFRFEQGWLATALVLYVVAVVIGIALFAPAIRRHLAEAQRDPTSPAYEEAARRTRLLGLVTSLLVVVIVILMVSKPF
jgi:uncharacterized membrane protein